MYVYMLISDLQLVELVVSGLLHGTQRVAEDLLSDLCKENKVMFFLDVFKLVWSLQRL